jgi:HIRAN domain
MLRKLRTAIQPPVPAGSSSPPAGQPTAVMLSGGLEVGVVGESHYQDALTAIVCGKRPESVPIPTQATLVLEPDNPYDPNAVAVYIAGRKVGHLPRPAAQAFAPVGRRLADQQQVGACSASITGGWDRGDGDTGHFGVTLDLAHPDQLLESNRL